MKINQYKVARIIYFILLACFVFPIIYISILLAIHYLAPEGTIDLQREPPEYGLMMLQCFLGIIVIHVPPLLKSRFRFEIPIPLEILYLIFLYCAIFLGEVRRFYITVPHWDDILHCFSSVMTGLFALMLVAVMNRGRSSATRLSPLFIALFAFTFSMTIGALWEIYEFTFDMWDLNMQKYRLDNFIPLTGRDALKDTMKDLIVDGVGALASSVVGFISLKNRKGWVHTYIQKHSEYLPPALDANNAVAIDGALPTVTDAEALLEAEPSETETEESSSVADSETDAPAIDESTAENENQAGSSVEL